MNHLSKTVAIKPITHISINTTRVCMLGPPPPEIANIFRPTNIRTHHPWPVPLSIIGLCPDQHQRSLSDICVRCMSCVLLYHSDHGTNSHLWPTRLIVET